jgi:hypothetical protein
VTERLPAVVGRAGVVGDTAPPLPALVAAAGDQAGVRFLEFFAAAIRSLPLGSGSEGVKKGYAILPGCDPCRCWLFRVPYPV